MAQLTEEDLRDMAATMCAAGERLSEDEVRQLFEALATARNQLADTRCERDGARLERDRHRLRCGQLETGLSNAHCLLQSCHGALDAEAHPDLAARLGEALECGLPQCRHVMEMETEVAELEAKVQWFVDHAADEKLDGYRALGERAAIAEAEVDRLRNKLNADSQNSELECRKAQIELLEAKLATIRKALRHEPIGEEALWKVLGWIQISWRDEAAKKLRALRSTGHDLRAQRDSLAEALREMLATLNGDCPGMYLDDWVGMARTEARAALEKLEEK